MTEENKQIINQHSQFQILEQQHLAILVILTTHLHLVHLAHLEISNFQKIHFHNQHKTKLKNQTKKKKSVKIFLMILRKKMIQFNSHQ